MTSHGLTSTKNKTNTKSLVITALFISLTYVFTAFVNIRLPIGGNGGLIHLGNIPLFIAAIVFGKKIGAVTGAVGMGLFDLLSGWTMWAPFTFIIVGAMGYFAGWITEGSAHQNRLRYLIAILIAGFIKVVGYYFAEVFLYGNIYAPVASIPGNIIQVGIAGMIIFPIVKQIRILAEKSDLL